MSFRKSYAQPRHLSYAQTRPVNDARKFKAPDLVLVESVYVEDLPFDIDTMTYREFMIERFIPAIAQNRFLGYVQIRLKASRDSNGEIAIYIRKRDRYVVAISDGQRVYEVGLARDRARYFDINLFTGFREKYSALFPKKIRNFSNRLEGRELGFGVLKEQILLVIGTGGQCWRWGYSVGIFALTFSEPARFRWSFDVICEVIDTGGSITMEGRLEWMAWLPLHWRDISKRARARGDDDDGIRGHQRNIKTNRGARDLLDVKCYALRALIYQTWDYSDKHHTGQPNFRGDDSGDDRGDGDDDRGDGGDHRGGPGASGGSGGSHPSAWGRVGPHGGSRGSRPSASSNHGFRRQRLSNHHVEKYSNMGKLQKGIPSVKGKEDNQPELVDLLGEVSDATSCSDVIAAVNTEARPTEAESTCSDSIIQGDVRNKQDLEKLFSQAKFDAIIHFAGLKAVGESMAPPFRYFDNNLTNCKKLVFSSSATVYGRPKKIPCIEDFELKAMNPYGRTKVRDYIHVMDLADGQDAALKKLFTKEDTGCFACNLGTGKGTSVLEMVTAFEKASGKKIPVKFCPRRPGDATEVYPSTDKAASELDWKAKYGIDEMCRDQWNWARQNPWGYSQPSNT